MHDPDPGGLVKTLVAVFVLLTAIYVATATHSVAQSNDTRAAAVSAWSLGEDGTFELPRFRDVPWPVLGRDRNLYTDRFPGVILWGAVFYAVLPGSPTPPDTLRLDHTPAAVAAAVAAAGAATALLALFLAMGAGRRTALAGTVLFALGTATWSVSADALWTHGPAQLALVLAMLAMHRDRWWLAGLAFGAAVLLRPHLVVAAGLAGLVVLLSTRSWRRSVPLVVGGVVGLLGVSLYSWMLFERLLPVAGYSTSGLGSAAGPLRLPIQVLGTLFDPRRGVLVHSPFLLALLPGVRAGWAALPTHLRAAAVGGLGYLGVSLLLLRYSGGDGFFAYRVPLETLTLCAPLLLASWQQWTSQARWRRVALASLGGLSIVVQAVGAIHLSVPREDVEAWEQRLEEAEVIGPHEPAQRR